MAHDVPMPKVAMAMNEGTVTEWARAEGEHVEKGEHLLTIETEKTAYELDAPATGLLHIISEVGSVVPTEEIIGYLAESEDELAELQAAVAVAAAAPKAAAAVAAAAAPAAAPAAPATPRAVAAATPGIVNEGRIVASPLAKRVAEDKGIDALM